jgi:hypothetical protein
MTHTASDPGGAVEVFRTQRHALRALRRICVGRRHVVAVDINGDTIRIEGIGIEDPEIRELLKLAGASFNPKTVHNLPEGAEEKEYEVVRADPWGHDRVL